MKQVAMRGGAAVALVDDVDFEAVAEFSWAPRTVRNGPTYAANTRGTGPRTMHELVAARAGITGAEFIDHRNRNGLDNTRLNLRPASRAQNGWNAIRAFGASGFPGVHKNRGRWAVRFDHNGAPVYFGTHADLAVARRIAAARLLELRGDFLPDELRALCRSALTSGDQA